MSELEQFKKQAISNINQLDTNGHNTHPLDTPLKLTSVNRISFSF